MCRRLVLADIPGLIHGAHRGAGLGHDFLRHIERTRMLVHLLEVEPSDGSDPIDNYLVIRRELREDALALTDKPQIIALNRMDLLGGEADQQTAVDLIEQGPGLEVLPISAATGQGCDRLLRRWEALQQQPQSGGAGGGHAEPGPRPAPLQFPMDSHGADGSPCTARPSVGTAFSCSSFPTGPQTAGRYVCERQVRQGLFLCRGACLAGGAWK